MFWRNVIANRNLEALIKDQQVLEIGGNNGDITVQLYDYGPKFIMVKEISSYWMLKLDKRFKNTPSISCKLFSITEQSELPKDRFDVIVLKEILNALPRSTYNEIFKNSLSLLKQNAFIVIIDYVPLTKYRQFFLSILRHPLSAKKFWNLLINNIKLSKTCSRKELFEYFPNDEFNLNYIFGVDPLNRYDSFYHKVMEMIFPHKYMLIIQRKKL